MLGLCARDAPPRLPVAKDCHCDGCHSVGCQTASSSRPVLSPLQKGIQGARQQEAPNFPASSTCFAPLCCKPSLEEEVGPSSVSS